MDTVGKRVGEGEVVGIGELVGDALVVVGKSVGTNVGDSVSFSSSLLDMEGTYLCLEEELKLRPIDVQSKTFHEQCIPFTYSWCCRGHW